jgi:UDP-N-acetylmuramoylalanine--D-glutamate ligase
VLVVGLGRSGIAAAQLCAARGARVTVTDKRDAARWRRAGRAARAIARELGGHRRETFTGAELIVLSPGVPEIPELAAARAAGVAITGEMELASRFVSGTLIAITGTNGKSTTTTLVGDIMRATGRPTFVGGNLGDPLAEAVGTPAAAPGGVCVVEASSFQLETAETVPSRGRRAAEHHGRPPRSLRRHGCVRRRQGAHLRRADGERQRGRQPRRRSGGRGQQRRAGPPARLFGHAPAHRRRLARVGRGDDGLMVRLPDGPAERYPAILPGLVGRHNQANALAALLAGRLAGATPAQARSALLAFRPLEHRMELVAETSGVAYYDDSKGTNVGAVVASLDGFPRPVVLIAGGRDKGGDYAPLAAVLKRFGRAAILIGEAADKIETALRGVLPVERAATMDDAVDAARRLAQPGDAVVLSPACSSFDMFRDYKHRAEVFRAAVAHIAAGGQAP